MSTHDEGTTDDGDGGDLGEGSDVAEAEASEPSRRGSARDPLSIFLIGAALLLGLMYLTEQRSLTEIEEASAHARSIGQAEAFRGCAVEAAGPGGVDLVVRCEDRPVEALVSTMGTALTDVDGFDTVLFVGARAQLDCPVGADWPVACKKREKPTAEDVARAKRGGRPQ